MEIVRNPTGVKMLATILNKVCDDYICMKITEKQLKELIFHYATYHGKKLFGINGLNPTIVSRIGKKRVEIINIMLNGFQFSIM